MITLGSIQSTYWIVRCACTLGQGGRSTYIRTKWIGRGKNENNSTVVRIECVQSLISKFEMERGVSNVVIISIARAKALLLHYCRSLTGGSETRTGSHKTVLERGYLGLRACHLIV